MLGRLPDKDSFEPSHFQTDNRGHNYSFEPPVISKATDRSTSLSSSFDTPHDEPQSPTDSHDIDRLLRSAEDSTAKTGRARRVSLFNRHASSISKASASRRQRPKASLHKMLNSLFAGMSNSSNPSSADNESETSSTDALGKASISSQETPIAYADAPAIAGAAASDARGGISGYTVSTPWYNGNSTQGLEIVSPGAFIFSGPDIRNMSHTSSLGRSALLNSSRPSLSTHTSDSHCSFRHSSSTTYPMQGASVSTDTDETQEGFILEPYKNSDGIRSMCEILLSADRSLIDSTDSSLIEQGCMRSVPMPNDSPTRTHVGPTRPAPKLPLSVMAALLPYLDQTTHQSLLLTCRSWRSALSNFPPPQLSTVQSSPLELIQQIYSYLRPLDFNAARHTCRTWMLASLERGLLISMLKRGGWWSSAHHDLVAWEKCNEAEQLSPGAEGWLLSRRISRECALGYAWTGNGLRTEHTSGRQPGNDYATTLVQTAHTDFGDLASGYAGPQARHSGGLVFTVSVCGKYLLVAEGGMIYVYQLDGNHIRPITSVVCPRRVLAMSMDASSGRFAVAALLDGRMGLVCDLHQYRPSTVSPVPLDHSPSIHGGHPDESKCSVFTSRLFPNSVEGPPAGGRQLDDCFTSRPQSSDQRTPTFNAIDIQNSAQNIELQGTDDERRHERNFINQTWNIRLRGTRCMPASSNGHQNFTNNKNNSAQSIPLEIGPHSIYRHLCSDDDPPRSVAICPQRRCVAFGCSAGIELHWVDALTGQDLNRWFPLTASSDFLYFLPPRAGVDSAKKLRLISSAAHPTDRPALCRRFYAARPGLTSLWGAFNRSLAPPLGVGVRDNCDHYRAVPLSDGFHILFTDPASGLLCLGSDAPLGGPTKLLRKIMFAPPVEGAVPRLYAASADLSWGPRVVAAYGDCIVLFSVPPDVFRVSREEQEKDTSEWQQGSGVGMEWWDWWPEQDRVFAAVHSNGRPFWPLRVRGTVVGEVEGLVDVAVNSTPELTIWAFGLDGRAVTWQVDSGWRPLLIAGRTVTREGLVVDACEADADGDVMKDAGEDVERTVGFDGNASALLRIPAALHVDNDADVGMVDVPPGAWYDQDGDVIMVDGPLDT